ncbi:MAG: CRTAC1 family protein [Acidobacteriota bacterium]|nr:CRTAC1 family protein [Acidobacteriota bacterium]MDH3786095.1 CRTAC1 family protein [Acidobacteriota bacterium]
MSANNIHISGFFYPSPPASDRRLDRPPPRLSGIWLLCLLLLAACSAETARVSTRDDLAGARKSESVSLPDPVAGGGFKDVTLGAGIRARHHAPTPDLTNIIDAVGGGAAFGDLDGDGWLDLVVASGPRSPDPDGAPDAHQGMRLYRNLGNGTFEDVTDRTGIPASTGAVAIAVGDVNGDGHRDLYLADRGPNRLFINRGDGSFDEASSASGVADPRFSVGAAFLDIEDDGDLDLYVANYLEFDPREDNFFAPDGYPGPLSYKAEGDTLYRNRGDGTFEDVTSSSGIGSVIGRGMSIATADFDRDGDTDIFVANDATANFLLLNDGSGLFSENGLVAGVAMGVNGEQTAAMAADVGDLDGDGLLDLAVSDTSYGAVYRQTPNGGFRDEVMGSGVGALSGQYVSWGQNLLDFDNDGRLDLFVANGGLHHLVGWEDLLMRNVGDFRFEDATEAGGSYFASRNIGRSSIVADYDNDGDMDLFVTSLNGHHVLLRNDIAGRDSWVMLDLVGRRSRDPFGAQVQMQIAGETLGGASRSRSAYLGQGDSRLHFGLGPEDRSIDRIRIDWPGGGSSVVSNVAPRQIVRIEEGL